jgi:hypothetical protein
MRNSLFLYYLLHQLSKYSFTSSQSNVIYSHIRNLYQELGKKLSPGSESYDAEVELSLNRYQCAVGSLTNQSEKSHSRYEEEDN